MSMATSNCLGLRLGDLSLEVELKEEESKGIKWGMALQELYLLALHFYKDKSGKAIHLSYEDNLRLVAFTQQVVNGPFDSKNASQLGVLDVIGKDRRLAWQKLGLINKSQSMEGFIALLNSLCSSFQPYVEAIKRDKEERLRLDVEKKQHEQKILERELIYQDELREREVLRNKDEIQRRQLQDALNQQTFNQFKEYAEKQFPRNPEQQSILIRQLQNEHYHQYMQQIHANNKNSEHQYPLQKNFAYPVSGIEYDITEKRETGYNCSNPVEECASLPLQEHSTMLGNFATAKMWTRPHIKLFKEEVSIGSGDGVINIGHGDTVTVRVPTHESGNCIFWEFATDNFDIGFGVYFEWGKSIVNEVTVHVSESDDDEEVYEDEDDADDFSTIRDLECGPFTEIINNPSNDSRPPISIIVPVYRRECQTEVYVGSHSYPGEGVYLLKFDNSFSIWRSKTLYYRVYYER